MANELNDLINNYAEPFVPKWTITELIDWWKTCIREEQVDIYERLEKGKKFRSEYRIFHELREEIEPWTEAEMATWLQEQTAANQAKIVPVLAEARDSGLRPFRVLTKLRQQVGDSGTSISFVDYCKAAWTGYSKGCIAADLPSAIRNLSNMNK
jgi:hypothetical protein